MNYSYKDLTEGLVQEIYPKLMLPMTNETTQLHKCYWTLRLQRERSHIHVTCHVQSQMYDMLLSSVCYKNNRATTTGPTEKVFMVLWVTFIRLKMANEVLYLRIPLYNTKDNSTREDLKHTKLCGISLSAAASKGSILLEFKGLSQQQV